MREVLAAAKKGGFVVTLLNASECLLDGVFDLGKNTVRLACGTSGQGLHGLLVEILSRTRMCIFDA